MFDRLGWGTVALLLGVGGTAGCTNGRTDLGGESHFVACGVDADCAGLSGDQVCIERECRPRSERTVDSGGGGGQEAGSGGASGGSDLEAGAPPLPDARMPDGGGQGTGGGGTVPGEGGTLPLTGCAALDTGYSGDEYCMDAPALADALFLHFGPNDYDDPDEVAKYLVAPGDEVADCAYQDLALPESAYVGRMRSSARPSVHDIRAFVEKGVAPAVSPVACSPSPVGAQALLEATTPTMDTGTPPPEYARVATQVVMGSFATIRLHNINITDQPILREAWIRLDRVAASEVTSLRGVMELVGGFGMNVAPFSNQTILGGGASCAVPEARSVMSLAGVTGSHAARMSVYVEHGGDAGARTLVYESYSWSERPLARYDSVTANPAPDPVPQTDGAFSGVLVLEPGEFFSWECDMRNTSDLSLRYGVSPVTGERCDLIGSYVTQTGAPWRCTTF